MEGKRVLGSVPGVSRIVAERFFDETGGIQLVIHAPFGARINKAWDWLCAPICFEALAPGWQASATRRRWWNLSFEPQHSFPFQDLFQCPELPQNEESLTQAVLSSPVFVTRWRWTLTRALGLLRFAGGKRVPAPLQRMRSEDLLAVIFSGSSAGQG